MTITTGTNQAHTIQRNDVVKPHAWGRTSVFACGQWLPAVEVVFTPECCLDELLAVFNAARLQALADAVRASSGAAVGGGQ